VAIVHPPTQEHNAEVSNCAGEPRHPRFNNSSPMRIATSFKLKAAQFITSLRRIAKLKVRTFPNETAFRNTSCGIVRR
jgi:hypothetical protein